MKKLDEMLAGAGSVAITGHVHPDGDCVGSCLGLYHYIRRLLPEADVRVYLEPFRAQLAMLKGAEDIRINTSEEFYPDVCMTLDCGDEDRMGENNIRYYQNAAKKICIDHHITNTGFGDISVVCPTASSTSEVLYTLMDEEKIDKDVAQCLYLGIVHDTGVFKHSNTASQTMAIAGKLIDAGAEPAKIIDETFYKKTFAQNKALGRALDSARLFLDGAVVAGVIFLKDLKELGLGAKELDGIVDQLRITEGVQVAVFLYETAAGSFKVSMRANGDVDVSAIAGRFGGGGHKKAAGCNLDGDWLSVAETVAGLVAEQLRS